MAVSVWSSRTWNTSWNYQDPGAITLPWCVGLGLFLLNFSWRRLNKAKSVWFLLHHWVHNVQPSHPWLHWLCCVCAASKLTPTPSHPCAEASQHAAVEEGTVPSTGSCAQLCFPRRSHAWEKALCKRTGEGAGTLVTEGFIDPGMPSLEALSIEREKGRKTEKGRHCRVVAQGRNYKAFENHENHGPLPGRKIDKALCVGTSRPWGSSLCHQIAHSSHQVNLGLLFHYLFLCLWSFPRLTYCFLFRGVMTERKGKYWYFSKH